MRRRASNQGQTTILAIVAMTIVALAVPLALQKLSMNERKALSGARHATTQHRIQHAIASAANSPLALWNTYNDPANVATFRSCIDTGTNCGGNPAIQLRNENNVVIWPLYDINAVQCTTPSERCMIRVDVWFDTLCAGPCNLDLNAQVRVHYRISQDPATIAAGRPNMLGSVSTANMPTYQGQPVKFTRVQTGI